MQQRLNIAFLCSLFCPFASIALLFMTNSGKLDAQIAAPILFIAFPLLAVFGLVVGLLSLRAHRRYGEASGIVRKKAIATLIQSLFFLILITILGAMLANAIKQFN